MKTTPYLTAIVRYFYSQSIFTAFLFGVIFSPKLFASGGWTGNGGFTTLEQNNPWFLGVGKIPYCVKVNKKFSINTGAVAYLIGQSSHRWGDFFNRYQMNLGFPYSSLLSFQDGSKKQIMTEFEPSNNCDAIFQYCTGVSIDNQKCHNQLSSTVLFLIGESNSVVDSYINLNGSAAGAAIRTEYNHSTGQSGGIIWISGGKNRSWSQTSHLLLHEIGHIFGMKHDSCWVMSKNIAHFLSNWPGLGKLEQIESASWPYSFKTGDSLLFTGSMATFEQDVPESYFPNKYYLQGLESILGFTIDNSFQLSAEITNSSFGSLSLSLKFIEHPTGKTITLSGTAFAKNYSQSLVPSLYTKWNYKSTLKPEYSMDYMDAGWVSDNLQGVLILNQRKVPFTLERKKGMILSLFFEEKGTWVTFGSVQQDVTNPN